MILQIAGMKRGQRPLTVEILRLWCLQIDNVCKVLRDHTRKDNQYDKRATNALWQPSLFYKMLLYAFLSIPEFSIAMETPRLRVLT